MSPVYATKMKLQLKKDYKTYFIKTQNISKYIGLVFYLR